MKNNTRTYILIILVALVWGIIGVKFFAALQPENEQVLKNTSTIKFSPMAVVENDLYVVNLLDRDPFLGTLIYKGQNKVRNQTFRKIKPKTDSKIYNSQIVYQGIIKQHDSNEKVFVVTIDNNQYLFKKGQEIKGFKLISGSSSKIILKHNNKIQTFELK